MSTNVQHRISKIVFIVPWPITAFEANKWNFAYLGQEGFQVAVYDVTNLLNRKSILARRPGNVLRGEFIRPVRTYRELDALLAADSHASLFIDYIVGLADITTDVEKLFRLLKKHDVRYAVISAGALPTIAQDPVSTLLSKARKVLEIKPLLRFIGRKLILALSKARVLYPVPYLVIGGDHEALSRYASKRRVGLERIVRAHSLDYDVFLNQKRSEGQSVVTSQDICVFLDDSLVHHSDFHLLGLNPLNGEEYYPSINRLFDFIEKEIGLPVIIAAHPRSIYESMPNPFNGRPIIRGETAELVAKSALVVAHQSTSVNFAVLYKKPIVLVKTTGIRRHQHLNQIVDALATSLGVEPIEIDSAPLRASWLKRDINLEKYDAYLYKYIKSREVPDDKRLWDIICSAVKDSNSGLLRGGLRNGRPESGRGCPGPGNGRT